VPRWQAPTSPLGRSARPHAWRLATGDRTAAVGPQDALLGGRPVWLLPNPSGLNAGWPLPRLIEAYAALRGAAY
jgi:TDG/mug DNA glycosylase family protein